MSQEEKAKNRKIEAERRARLFQKLALGLDSLKRLHNKLHFANFNEELKEDEDSEKRQDKEVEDNIYMGEIIRKKPKLMYDNEDSDSLMEDSNIIGQEDSKADLQSISEGRSERRKLILHDNPVLISKMSKEIGKDNMKLVKPKLNIIISEPSPKNNTPKRITTEELKTNIEDVKNNKPKPIMNREKDRNTINSQVLENPLSFSNAHPMEVPKLIMQKKFLEDTVRTIQPPTKFQSFFTGTETRRSNNNLPDEERNNMLFSMLPPSKLK